MATLKDIARSIAGSNNLKIGDAETFVTAIVDTILEGLEQDRMVKIKGFGTFKLTSVRDRESVNVNTGERVTISGHDKISFTPENGVRDLINKPFIHFDTVILSDSVSPEEMAAVEIAPEETPEEPAATVEAPVIEAPAVEAPAVEVPTVEEEPAAVAEEPAPVAEEPTAVAEESAPIAEEPAPVAEKPAEETEAENSSVRSSSAASLYSNEAAENTAAETEEPAAETEAENSSVRSSSAASLNNDETDDVDDEEDDDEDTSNCKKVFILYAVVINILVSIIAFVAGYYCSEHHVFFEPGIMDAEEYVETPVTPATPAQQNNPTATPSAATTATTATQTAAPATENAKPTTAQTTESARSTTAPAAETAKPATTPAAEKPKASEIPDQSKYNADARVRTGAYYIIGVDQTVTAREGQTIKSISRTYLGPDMECYVEALNGQKELKAGDKVKIPKLKLKKLVH